jgi:CspA family cold shock protein
LANEFRKAVGVISRGVVREFHSDHGWGVLDAPDVPGGCWVHFSALVMSGYRTLSAGQEVSFQSEAANQDGYAFRAVRAWPGYHDAPTEVVEEPSSGGAYRSQLVITFDPPDEP